MARTENEWDAKNAGTKNAGLQNAGPHNVTLNWSRKRDCRNVKPNELRHVSLIVTVDKSNRLSAVTNAALNAWTTATNQQLMLITAARYACMSCGAAWRKNRLCAMLTSTLLSIMCGRILHTGTWMSAEMCPTPSTIMLLPLHWTVTLLLLLPCFVYSLCIFGDMFLLKCVI